MFVNMLTNKKKTSQHPLSKLKFSGLQGDVFSRFLRFSSSIAKKHYSLFKEHGLTEAQFFTLMSIYLAENKVLTFSEISKLLMVSRANISGIIQRLEERRLIRRMPDSNDRRLVYARLTKEGEKLVESIRPSYLLWITGLFKDFSSQEMKVLQKMFERLSI